MFQTSLTKMSMQQNVFSINHLVSTEHLQKSGEISQFLCSQKVLRSLLISCKHHRCGRNNFI